MPVCCVVLNIRHCDVRQSTSHSSCLRMPCIQTFLNSLISLLRYASASVTAAYTNVRLIPSVSRALHPVIFEQSGCCVVLIRMFFGSFHSLRVPIHCLLQPQLRVHR